MGKLHLILCISFFGHLISAQLVIEEDQDATLSPNFPGFFGSIMHFPFYYFPSDTFFSSLRFPFPGIHWVNEVPAFSEIPRVEVQCDKSQLTLFVEKQFNGDILDGAQIQLGDGCYSNGELPDHLIFTYSLGECGTTKEVQNDLDVVSNTLYFSLQKSSSTWWNPSTVHITCVTKRSDDHLSFLVSDAPHENGRNFDIKLMNSSWTSTAESNVFKRGQVVHLRVSANTRSDEQLFVQSCFVSGSSEPHTKPKHAAIMNKGCAVPLDSSHAVAQFVDSDREDVVNLEVNTSFITSEFYIHCSVLVSNQINTSGSKSCNYNFIHFRWEDLSGNADVCKCCSSKCKGLSLKHRPHDATAIVSIGPLLIEDEDQIPSSIHVADSPQSTAETEHKILSGASFTNQQISLNAPRNMIKGGNEQGDALPWDVNTLTLFDGRPIPPYLEEAAIEEESQRKRRFGKVDSLSLPGEVKIGNMEKMAQKQAEVYEERNDVQPVIRSKIQLSRGVDGSQALSYEEEMMQEERGMGEIRNLGMHGFKNRGLLSTFLDLLRRMDKTE